MVQEMFLRKIPEDMQPWECNVNGVKYVYPAGTEQNVPAEVAALIDAYRENQEVDYPETGISFNDLQDKPFYETTEVLFDQTVEFNDYNSAQIPKLLPFAVGDSVRVTWNGVEYECTAFDASAATGQTGIVAVGNALAIGGADSGEPFAVATMPLQAITVIGSINNSSTTATVKIEHMVVKTIDPKFIPEGVGGGEVIVQDSAAASGVAVASSNPIATMNALEIAEAVLAGKNVYFVFDDNSLLPFTYGYRFAEALSGAMTASQLPEPYALFSSLTGYGMYYAVKVYPNGEYEVIRKSIFAEM